MGRLRRRAGDELRQLLQLNQRFALHNTFGAVRQIDIGTAQLFELTIKTIRHTRKDRAAQHEQLAGTNLG